jgi:phage gpG-like protein
MAIFDIRVSGLAGLQRNLKKLSKGLGDTKTLNKMRVAGMDGFIEKNFQTEGQLVAPGGSWKPLDRKTIAARRKGKRKASPKILQDTGLMKNTRKFVIGDKEAKIVFDALYANTHHFGSKQKNIPARPLFSNKAYAKTGKDKKIVQHWFNGEVKKAGTFIRRTII